MSWGGPFFVVLMVAISTFGWVANNWIRATHGYPLEDKHGRRSRKGQLNPDRQIELLSTENGELKGQVSRLEERIAVLERIATDPAERTAREIDSLR